MRNLTKKKGLFLIEDTVIENGKPRAKEYGRLKSHQWEVIQPFSREWQEPSSVWRTGFRLNPKPQTASSMHFYTRDINVGFKAQSHVINDDPV